MGGKKSQVTGFRYYFGIHMGIGRGPVDELHEIKVGDRTAWLGSVASNTTINIDAYDLFGGEEKEGGVRGPFEVMMGESDQVAPAGLTAMLGTPISGFRRVFTGFYNGIVSMNNPYPKAWKFRFNRVLKGWDGAVFEPGLAPIRIESYRSQAVDTPLIEDFDNTSLSGVENGVEDFGTGHEFVDGALRIFALSESSVEVANQVRLVHYNAGLSDLYIFDPLSSEVVATVDLVGINNDFQVTPDLPFVNNPANPGATIFGCIFEFDGVGGPSTGGGVYIKFAWGWWDNQWQTIAFFRDTGESATEGYPLGGLETGEYGFSLNNATRKIRFTKNGVSVLSFDYPTDATRFRALTRTEFANSFDFRSLLVNNYRVAALISAGLVSMNPAHIIYECLTNREWGRGLNATKLDADSFSSAAQALFSETFGLCMKWTRKDSIQAFVQSVLDHIGGTLYQSRITGLMTLKLIRADYDIDDLPVLDTDSGILEISDIAVGSSGNSVNAVAVKWHDPLTDEDRIVTVKNTAAVLRAGGAINSTTKEYIGIPTASLALRVAQRDLRASSTNLRRFTLTCDLRVDDVHPGDVLAIRDAVRAIPKMAVRVGRVRHGPLTDGKITLEVVQDVFALPARSFAVDVPSTHTPPDTTPCVDEQRVIELPYFMLAGTLSPADLSFVNPDGGYFAAMASKGKSVNLGVQLAVRESAPTSDDEPPDDSFICTP